MNPIQFYRTLLILNGCVPLVMLTWDAYHGQLGANSVNYALHVTGILSLLFLFFSLLMTPLRWVTGWGGWLAFRRSLGLYGFAYSILHVAIYVGFDRGLSLSSTLREIWMRRFLQVGTAAVLMMIPLAVTSTNAMIQRLGSRRWKLLHRLAYVIAVLGVIHYYMLVKSDVRQPLAFASVLTVLLGARLGRHYFELRLAATRQQGRAKYEIPEGTTNGFQITSAALANSHRPWKGELRVAAIFQETPDVKTFRLMAVDGGAFPFEYQPGQFLNVQLMIDGKRVNRSYTIASSPTRRDACELSIKREPFGLASCFVHDHLNVGDVLKVSGPAGKFVFTGDEASGVLLIAGGVGITPMMSIVRYLTDRSWSGDVYFLIVARTEQDLIFRNEIEWLQRRFLQLHVCTTLTRCGLDSLWNGHQGRISESLLNHFVPELTRIPVFLCGPNEMMDATRDLLTRMGLAGTRIRTEAFVSRKTEVPSELKLVLPSGHSNVERETWTGPQVIAEMIRTESVISFARSKIQAAGSSENSVLESAEASSVQLPYECRSGICGQCKLRLVEGSVVMDCEDALSPSEKARGFILACQARPLSNLVVDA